MDVKMNGEGNIDTLVPQKYRKYSDFLSDDYSANNSSLTHQILDNNGNVIEVCCYLDHRLRKAWTLVMSFSYENYETHVNIVSH